MPTKSAHSVTATAVLPSVNVPGYELVPGYTTQIPGSVLQQTFDTTLDGWTGGANTSVTLGTHPSSGDTAMILVRTGGAAGSATATRTFTGLIVGRKYFASSVQSVTNPSNDRVMRLPATAGSIAAESGAGAGGYGTMFIATATSQTITLGVDGVPAGDPGFEPVGMYVRDFKLTLLATSVFTPPVMQPPTTVAGRTVTLDVKGSSVTLDDSWSPYAQAELVCYAPSIEITEALDPRKKVRVSVTLTQQWGDSGGDWNGFGYRAPVTRTFDLYLADRAVDKDSGEMKLKLQGDEALLQEWALVSGSTDFTPITLQASLRGIVGYALSKIGASLPAGEDTHVTVSATPNLFKNPSGRRGLTGYTVTGGALGQDIGQDAYISSSTAGAVGTKGLFVETKTVGVDGLEANTKYVLSMDLLAVGQSVAPILYASGTGVQGVNASATSIADGDWHRIAVPFTTSAAGTVALVFFNSAAVTASAYVMAFRDAQLEKGGVATPYFDGAKAADARYTYSWQGAADASASARTLVLPRSEQLLDWTPGKSAWDFLQPIVQATGYRLWCDEARVWHLAKAWNTQTQINIAPETGLTAGVDLISRAEGDWYDSVVIEYRWTDRAGAQQVAYDVAGTPGNSTKYLRYDNTPFPGAGAAASVQRRADGKGRIIAPSAINNYVATPGQVLQISLPDTPVQTGMLSSVNWRTPEDVMSVGSRALTDTPASAWINAIGTWAAATGTWASITGTN